MQLREGSDDLQATILKGTVGKEKEKEQGRIRTHDLHNSPKNIKKSSNEQLTEISYSMPALPHVSLL